MGGIARSRRRDGGFTLIEIVVVMAILSLVIAMAAAITRALSAAQKRSLTVTRMAAVDAALLQFVQQTKRLPCPADGTLPSGDTNAGLERRTGTACTDATLQNGVVPWRTLGLTEADATDAWERRFTYRLQPALAGNEALDMAWCDPAGSGPGMGATFACRSDGACNSSSAAGLLLCTSPTNFLANKGLQVRNLAGTILMNPAGAPHTGAAYVVISHGETGGGGYLSSGVLGQSTVTDGTEEAKNYANVAYVAANYFVDDVINETSGAAHFDDIVSRPGLLTLINKAGLGPRSH